MDRPEVRIRLRAGRLRPLRLQLPIRRVTSSTKSFPDLDLILWYVKQEQKNKLPFKKEFINIRRAERKKAIYMIIRCRPKSKKVFRKKRIVTCWAFFIWKEREKKAIENAVAAFLIVKN